MAKPDQKKPAAEGSEQVSPPSPAPAILPPPLPEVTVEGDGVAKTPIKMTLDPATGIASGKLEAKAEAPAAKPGLVHAPAPAPQATATRATYRVWSHGTLQRNGKTYRPGETLTLDIAEADKIPCLERVES